MNECDASLTTSAPVEILSTNPLYSLDQVVYTPITVENDFLLSYSSFKQSDFTANKTEYKVLDIEPLVLYPGNNNDIEDLNLNLKSLVDICIKDDEEPDNWWYCAKCHKKIMDGEYHKKYCNSKKDKHKHKLLKDCTKQFVKDKCCFRCGRKGHYILDCIYSKIN